MIANFVPRGCIDLIQMLICQGLLWSMIVTILMFNELSLSCIVFCAVPWFVFLNWHIAIDLICFEKEPAAKTTFVRLIGQHDSIFLFLIFTAYLCFNTVLDSLNYWDAHQLSVLVYLPWALYVFNRLMDERPASLRKSWLPYLITCGSLIAIFVYLKSQVELKNSMPPFEREYPLWQEKKEQVNLSTED